MNSIIPSNDHSPIKQELLCFFKKEQPLIIFDIGSCDGMDSIVYHKLFPNAIIYAIEPLEDNYLSLLNNVEAINTNNIKPFNIALSNEETISPFYVSTGPKTEEYDYGNKSSSLLKPDLTLKTHPWLKFEKIINVQTKTLYSFCINQKIAKIDFIHMDVQGAELAVLKGAMNLIEHISLIWLEVSTETLYQNQPLKTEVQSFMKANNFQKIKDTVNHLSGDQLYINNKFFIKQKGYLRFSFKRFERFILDCLYSLKINLTNVNN